MPKSVLGINMGNHTIKAVELAHRGNSFIMQNLLVAPTQEAIVSGELIQPDVVAATLKDWLRNAGVRTRETVVAVGGQTGVIVRVTELPKMTRRELMQAIPLEIERHLPFQSGGVMQDYVLLKTPEEVAEGEQIPVLFAAAREDLVDAYLMAIQQAGLSPLAIEVEPLAALRALQAARGFGEDGREGQISVLVNIGHEGTEISFVEGNALIFTRFVPSGGRHLTEDIRDQLGMDLEEAERVKVELGTAWVEQPPTAVPSGTETQALPSQPTEAPPAEAPKPPEPERKEAEPTTISFELPTESAQSKPEVPSFEFSLPTEPLGPSLEFLPAQPPSEPTPPSPPAEVWAPSVSEPEPLNRLIYNAINPRLTELAGEIARSVEFLMSQRPNIAIGEVYLLGGGSLLKDLDKFLEAQLGVRVIRLNPFRYIDTSPVTMRLGHDYLNQMAPLCSVAVGLALWAYV